MRDGLKLAIALGVAALGSAGCDNTSTHATAGHSAVMVLSDAESASVLSRLSAGQLEAAQVFRPLAAHDEVIGFADRMRDDHVKVDGLLLATGIAEQPNAVGDAIDSDFAEVNALVTGAGAVAAEPVYVNSQVALHQQALLLIDCALIPGTTSEPFRDFLFNSVRPKVREGLEAATHLAATMSGASGGGGSTGGALTVAAPATDRCADACDPALSTGFSVELRAAACR